MAPKLFWRRLRRSDLSDVSQIACRVHPELPERPDVFEEKLRLFPLGCFTLDLDGRAVGYSFAHPWMLDEIPPLDSFIGSLPNLPNCLFLHDVAILSGARGSGSATTLVDLLTDIARAERLGFLTLVAVYGADKLWRRFGFEAHDLEELSDKLGKYGHSARFMKKSLELL